METLSSFSKNNEKQMITSKYRLELARKLKLYKEVSTEDGTVLIAEAEEMAVGVEVFVDGADGLEPAKDGEYVDTVNNVIYIVSGGTITEIREKEIENQPAEENTEEGAMENQEGSENGEGNDNNDTTDGTNSTSEVEAEVEALKAENETLKAKIAELEATVSDLEDQIAAYKAKEEETEAPAAEEAEKFASQKPKTSFDKTMEAAKLIMKAVK